MQASNALLGEFASEIGRALHGKRAHVETEEINLISFPDRRWRASVSVGKDVRCEVFERDQETALRALARFMLRLIAATHEASRDLLSRAISLGVVEEKDQACPTCGRKREAA